MIPPALTATALIPPQTVRAGGNHLRYTSVPPSVVNHTSTALDVLHHQHAERVWKLWALHCVTLEYDNCRCHV